MPERLHFLFKVFNLCFRVVFLNPVGKRASILNDYVCNTFFVNGLHVELDSQSFLGLNWNLTSLLFQVRVLFLAYLLNTGTNMARAMWKRKIPLDRHYQKYKIQPRGQF